MSGEIVVSYSGKLWRYIGEYESSLSYIWGNQRNRQSIDKMFAPRKKLLIDYGETNVPRRMWM